MHKKLIAGIAALSLAVPSVAFAEGRHGDYRGGYDRHYERHEHRHHNDTGEKVAIGLGALVLGAIIAGSSRNSEPSYRYETAPVYEPQYRYCVDRQIVRYNQWGDRYVYYVRECN